MYLLDFIKNNKNWEELLQAEPYNVKITRDEQYIIFKYNQLSSDFTDPIVRDCRGIILKEPEMSVVCFPFVKFGNMGENYCPEIEWETASVQQKVDGSLMKVWFDADKWHVSTNGTIDAFKAELASIKYKSFGELFLAALPVDFDSFTNSLDKDFTYMFELVSPYNRVVIPYDNTELYFLGARNNITYQEVLPENMELAYNNWFKMPLRYTLHSLADVQNAADALPWDEEGYVVCDKDFNRVKIKSPEYVKAHYARANNCISKKALLDIIRAGEQAEFLIYAADYKAELEAIEKQFNDIKADILGRIKAAKPEQFASRRDYAEFVLKQPKWVQRFLFAYTEVPAMFEKIETAKWIELIDLREGLFNG